MEVTYDTQQPSRKQGPGFRDHRNTVCFVVKLYTVTVALIILCLGETPSTVSLSPAANYDRCMQHYNQHDRLLQQYLYRF